MKSVNLLYKTTNQIHFIFYLGKFHSCAVYSYQGFSYINDIRPCSCHWRIDILFIHLSFICYLSIIHVPIYLVYG